MLSTCWTLGLSLACETPITPSPCTKEEDKKVQKSEVIPPGPHSGCGKICRPVLPLPFYCWLSEELACVLPASCDTTTAS